MCANILSTFGLDCQGRETMKVQFSLYMLQNDATIRFRSSILDIKKMLSTFRADQFDRNEYPCWPFKVYLKFILKAQIINWRRIIHCRAKLPRTMSKRQPWSRKAIVYLPLSSCILVTNLPVGKKKAAVLYLVDVCTQQVLQKALSRQLEESFITLTSAAKEGDADMVSFLHSFSTINTKLHSQCLSSGFWLTDEVDSELRGWGET